MGNASMKLKTRYKKKVLVVHQSFFLITVAFMAGNKFQKSHLHTKINYHDQLNTDLK